MGKEDINGRECACLHYDAQECADLRYGRWGGRELDPLCEPCECSCHVPDYMALDDIDDEE